MISAHKKSRALQETSVQVCARSAKPATSTVSAGISNVVKKDCASSICTVPHSTCSMTGIVAETPIVAVPNSFVEFTYDRDLQRVCENVDGIPKSTADSKANNFRGEECGALCAGSHPLSVSGKHTQRISETQYEVCGQKNICRMPDMSSALAKDMVNLYRNKVLPKINSSMLVSSSCCPYSAVPASAANSGVDSCKISHTVVGTQVPISSTRQLKMTDAAKATFVSKSPFKLVKTFQPSVCCGETGLPPVSKSLPATAHVDRDAPNILGTRTCHLDTILCSTSESDNHVSCLSSVPHNFSVQIIQAVSNNSNAISSQSNCATVFLANDFPHGKNATPNVKTCISSKYKLIRRRELPCRNTARQTSVKDTNVSPYVTRRVVKHSPTLVAVNKYRLVRKKRHSLTMSAKRTDIKTSPLINLGSDILPPFCSNSSTSSKMRSSRYKLVRDNHQPHSTLVRKPNRQSSSNQTGPFCGNSLTSNSNIRSGRYKLVRKNQPYSASVRKLIRQPASNQAGPFCGNSSVSRSKTRLSRYKLVRASNQPHSKSVKTLGRESAVNQAGDKIQVLSKYKLIRQKCNAMSRTDHRATLTPASSYNYTRRLYNKYMTPPLFLNKYKLIRKRALLRTNSRFVKNSTLRSSHCLKHI